VARGRDAKGCRHSWLRTLAGGSIGPKLNLDEALPKLANALLDRGMLVVKRD
jgi:hypothetical protein